MTLAYLELSTSARAAADYWARSRNSAVKLSLETDPGPGPPFGAVRPLRGDVLYGDDGYGWKRSPPRHTAVRSSPEYPLVAIRSAGTPASRSLDRPYEADRTGQGIWSALHRLHIHHEARRSLHDVLLDGRPGLTGVDTLSRTAAASNPAHELMAYPARCEDGVAARAAAAYEGGAIPSGAPRNRFVYRVESGNAPVGRRSEGQYRGSRCSSVAQAYTRAVARRSGWRCRRSADGIWMGNGPGRSNDLAPLSRQGPIAVWTPTQTDLAACASSTRSWRWRPAPTPQTSRTGTRCQYPLQTVTRRCYIRVITRLPVARRTAEPVKTSFVNVRPTMKGIRSATAPRFSINFHP